MRWNPFSKPHSINTRGYTKGAVIKPSVTKFKRDGTPRNVLHAKKGQSFYSLRYLTPEGKFYIIGLYTHLEKLPHNWWNMYFVEHWKPNMDVELMETMWMEDFHSIKHARMKDGKPVLTCWGMDGDTRPCQEKHQAATGREWCFKHFGKCPA